jgi:hypothetical protein
MKPDARFHSPVLRRTSVETVSGELVKPEISDRLERGMKHIPREDLLKRIRVSLILDWLAA